MGSGYEAGGTLDISLINDEIIHLFNDIESINDGAQSEKLLGVSTIPHFSLNAEDKEIELEYDQCDPDDQMLCLKAIIEKIKHTGAVIEGQINWNCLSDSESFGYYEVEDGVITEYKGVVDYVLCDDQNFK